MKQVIVMLAMILLGIAIFQIVAGEDEDSVLSTMKGVWQQEIQVRTTHP